MENTEWATKNGQSSETGNIGHTIHWQYRIHNTQGEHKQSKNTTQDEEKQKKSTTQYVFGHHFTQTNTNNVHTT